MMALALQVVSSHHLGALDIEKALSVQEFLSNASCHTPPAKPRRLSSRIARAFFCWTVVREFAFGAVERPIACQFAVANFWPFCPPIKAPRAK